MLAHREMTCLKGKAAIYSARLLSVSRQVRAHLWHKGPAGGLSRIRTHKRSTVACLEVPTLPLSVSHSIYTLNLLFHIHTAILLLQYYDVVSLPSLASPLPSQASPLPSLASPPPPSPPPPLPSHPPPFLSLPLPLPSLPPPLP